MPIRAPFHGDGRMPNAGVTKLSRHSSRPRAARQRRLSSELERLEDRVAPATGLSASTQQLIQAYGQLPLSFEVNDGQADSQVQYLTQGTGYSLDLNALGATLSLQKPLTVSAGTSTASSGGDGATLAMSLLGSDPNAAVAGEDQLPGTSNYFVGNDPAEWHTKIAQYGQVEYQDVYQGINLIYYGNQQQLEYDFQVAPGANPSAIRFGIQGAENVSLEQQGDLVLHTPTGDVIQQAPVMYQDVNGGRQPVAGQFLLYGQDEVGFQVGSYNHDLPLTIDPILSYSTYLGGAAGVTGTGIAVNASGDAYITGSSPRVPTSSS